MAKTSIADIIVPSLSEGYFLERTAELSAFVSSGIVQSSPRFDELAERPGREVKMPFFQDLTGERQILSDTASLAVNKITTGQDIARIQTDANAWGANDLTDILTGANPMQAIIDLVGGFWARVDEGIIIATLQGVFASPSMADNKLSIASETIAGQSAATHLNGTTFVDATQRLGDRGDQLTAIAIHSATEAALRKADLIEFMPDSEGKLLVRTFQGRRVVVDDTLPVRQAVTDGKVYTSYLFGPGAFARGTARLTDPVLGGAGGTRGVEYGRDILGSDDLFVNRRRFILHPRGVRFIAAAVVGESPNNIELADGANWARAWEAKNVRLVAIEHN
jgi:hypothetical protein